MTKDYLNALALSVSYFYFSFRVFSKVFIRFFVYSYKFNSCVFRFCYTYVAFSWTNLINSPSFFLTCSSLFSNTLFLFTNSNLCFYNSFAISYKFLFISYWFLNLFLFCTTLPKTYKTNVPSPIFSTVSSYNYESTH